MNLPAKQVFTPRDIANALSVCVKTVDRFAAISSVEWQYITPQQRVLDRDQAVKFCDAYAKRKGARR